LCCALHFIFAALYVYFLTAENRRVYAENRKVIYLKINDNHY